MAMVPQRHRRTDRQTDGRLTVAIPCDAYRAMRPHSASHSENNSQNITAHGITETKQRTMRNLRSRFEREVQHNYSW